VALAAGHRPCFFCRRADAQAFRAAWGKAKGVCARSWPATGRSYTPTLKIIPISDLGCCRLSKPTLASAGLIGRDASIAAYSLNRDRIAKPDPRHSFGADRRSTAEPSYFHRDHASTAIAGSVTVPSSANPVFGICLSCRMGAELSCR
jgi:hypothetical protein